jgi:hypothetical protein
MALAVEKLLVYLKLIDFADEDWGELASSTHAVFVVARIADRLQFSGSHRPGSAN